MQTTTLRLRRVRFKNGKTVEVLRPKDEGLILRRFQSSARNIAQYKMAGFAMVAWSAAGRVIVNYENGSDSPVPGGGVPQYVKDCLLAELAVRWSKD